jgi:sugar/nucleoside kinase (ribokinase family)
MTSPKNNKYNYDIVTIGDVALGSFVVVADVQVKCDLKKGCLLCLNYADKIPARQIKHTPGGVAVNTAIGVNALGLKTALLSNIGMDENGREVSKGLSRNKDIDIFLNKQKNALTNYMVSITYQQRRALLLYFGQKKYNFPKFKSTKYIYLTPMSKGSEKIYPSLINYVKSKEVNLIFTPGRYEIEKASNKVHKLLPFVNIYISNVVEASELFNFKVNNDVLKKSMRKLLKKINNIGPQTILLTYGKYGAFVYESGVFYYLDILKEIEANYPTGAGDAFTAGFLSGLIKKEKIAEAMLWGGLNASSVIQSLGSHYGMLTRAKLNAMKKKFPYYHATEF